MLIERITDKQKAYAWELVNKTNFGKRGVFDGDKEKQYTGMLGQTVMADGICHKRPTGEGGFDNGVDFVIATLNVDLKTMGRTVEVAKHFVNNLVASQVKYATHVYVFASINKESSVFTINGFLKKEDMQQFFLPKGTTRSRDDGSTFSLAADMYEIPNHKLERAYSWTQLVDRIALIGKSGATLIR